MSNSSNNGIGLSADRVVTNPFTSKVTVVLGAQWGDEGKGKVVDMLATDVDIVCRCQVSEYCICILCTFVNNVTELKLGWWLIRTASSHMFSVTRFSSGFYRSCINIYL